MATVQGALALELPGLRGMPRGPELTLVAADGPDPLRAWAGRFGQAVVEVLGGSRPVSQLLRWTSPDVYDDLCRRVEMLGRTGAGRGRAARPQVRSVHVSTPTPGAAEVSVHVRHGQRSRAFAARLEARQGRWQCTALQFG